MDDKLNNLAKAFADGELTPEQQLEAMRQMRDDPQLVERVAHQQALRAAVSRAMRQDAGRLTAPASLRTMLEQTPLEQAAPTAEAGSAAVVGRIGFVSRWAPAALAAVLLLGAMMMYFAAPQRSGPPVAVNDDIIPASQVEMFGKRHVTCCRELARLSVDPTLANDLQQLPNQIASRFHASGAPSLDLTPLGYRFDSVGRCSIPGNNAVHLIYKAQRDAGTSGGMTSGGETSGGDAVSLWIVEDKGQLDAIPPGVIHTAGANRPHPVIVWRQGGMIYYLTADSLDRAERAAHMLHDQV